MSDASEPHTDRELMMLVISKIDHLDTKLTGEFGLCKRVNNHEERIDFIENRYNYILGGIGLLTFLVLVGRLIDFSVLIK